MNDGLTGFLAVQPASKLAINRGHIKLVVNNYLFQLN